MNDSYSVLANYYDKLSNKDCDYIRWSQYLSGVAQSVGATDVVDLACGTGKMTQLLTKHGYSCLGIDSSNQMLNVARSKVKATFVCQDMTQLNLTHPSKLIVCVNDGVNYLPQDKLPRFLQRVYDNLQVGGAFVFDISTAYKLNNVLANNVFYFDEKDVTLLWKNTLHSDKVVMDITIFSKVGNNYARSDETHTQYVYTDGYVAELLQKTGFTLKQVTTDYGLPYDEKMGIRTTFFVTKE